MSTTLTHPYSVLGDGSKTSLLRADIDWTIDTHTRVLSCENQAARGLAKHLADLASDLPNALWDVAVAFDGAPAAARRRLLGVFDGHIAAEIAADTDGVESPWMRADRLIEAVRAVLHDAPEAVRAAVRREITENILTGIDDGILVGGVLWADTRKAGYLRLILNPVMTDWTRTAADGSTDTVNAFFDTLDIDWMRQAKPDDFPTEVACLRLQCDDEFELVEGLRDYGACGDRPYGEDDADTIFDETDNEATPYLAVALSHLEAYMVANNITPGS